MIDTILITGCTDGLGRELALKFAHENYNVYAVGRRGEMLTSLAQESKRIHPIIADITTAEGRNLIVECIGNKKVSIIHNAVIAEPCQFDSISEELLRKHFETNCISPLLLTQRLLPSLAEGQRILHITSGAAKMPISGLLQYCTTKAAMQLAMDCLNAEMNDKGIYCGNLSPGMIDTPLGSKLRGADVKKLPSRDFYFRAKIENKLIKLSIAAEFVFWVFIKSDNSDFKKNAWNIYDESHQKYWLPQSEAKPMIL